MAVDWKVENKRNSTYLILPELITINSEMNGRHDLPDVEWLIESFVKHGQRTPVQISNDGGTPVLIAGHCRWRAAIEVNRRNLTPEPFKLNCSYYKATSELDSYLATISENYDRTAPKPIDEAKQIVLLERFGMSIEDMAKKVYRQDVAWVKARLALVGLCDEAQDAVSSGEIKKLSAAAVLAKMSKAAQKEVLKKSHESGEKITAASLKSPSGPKPARVTVSSLREFWSPLAEDRKGSDLGRLAEAQMAFLESGDSDAFYKAVIGFLRSAGRAS